jgi:hypothetical protein
MIYVVFYAYDNSHAPSEVDLDKYTKVGTVKAGSLSEAMRKWREGNYIRCLGEHRPLLTGDLVRDQNDKYFIVSPLFQFASVTLTSR